MKTFDVKKTNTFDIGATLNCGQVFRYHEIEGGYRVNALSHVADVIDRGDRYVINCDDADFFYRYFDFDTDYGFIQAQVDDKAYLSSAIEFGRGIHILRQDATEALFSFIISQNNHIPRIKKIIENMSDGLGEDMGEYRAFPTLAAIASKDEAYYQNIGAGYRAQYLVNAAKALENDDICNWNNLDTPALRAKLVSIKGVGRKVADCALLFGFNRFDVFPVDTWIYKVFENDYPGVRPDKMSTLLVEKYGKYAGFVQQWLFYYKREKKV